RAYTVRSAAASADARYQGLRGADVVLTNRDDDTAGILVRPTSGMLLADARGTASFTVVLTSQPTAEVTIDLSVTSPTGAVVMTSSLPFTPANWTRPKTVPVTGVVAGPYPVALAAAVSADPRYRGVDPVDLTIVPPARRPVAALGTGSLGSGLLPPDRPEA